MTLNDVYFRSRRSNGLRGSRPGLPLLLVGVIAASAAGQTSSLGERQRQTSVAPSLVNVAREAPERPRNFVYERYAWTAEKPAPPKIYRAGDLLTIIIREQRKWEADSELETKRKFDVNSQLDAFFKPIDGGLGSTTFKRGKPNVDYQFDSRLKGEGDADREDKLTTRLTAKIIDVKPNGLLVLAGVAQITHDEEISEVTITGTCRKDDVTADNTVLSTQIADKVLVVRNEGALRAANSRGWVTKLLDILKPI
jgi:flagellar L-ring protein precursor FlgH